MGIVEWLCPHLGLRDAWEFRGLGRLGAVELGRGESRTERTEGLLTHRPSVTLAPREG